MRNTKTMKGIAAAALAVALVAAPAVQEFSPLFSGTSLGVVASAAATEVNDAAGLKAAVESGGEIKVTGNITLTETITVAKAVKLDLNGNTITGPDGTTTKGDDEANSKVAGVFLVSTGGDLEVSDTGTGGKIAACNNTGWDDVRRYSVRVNGGKLTVKSGELYGQIYPLGASVVSIEGGKVTGKTFTTGYAFTDFAISLNGIHSKNSEVTISDGEVVGGDAGVYAASGNVNISGGKVSGNSAVLVRGSTVKITGGEITGNGAYKDSAPDYDNKTGDGACGNGDAIAVITSGGNYGASDVKIQGGEIKSDNAYAVGTYIDGKNVKDETAALVGIVEGGVFQSADGKDTFVTANTSAGATPVAATAGFVKVTEGGKSKTVLGTEEKINEYLDDNADVTAVEVVANVKNIEVGSTVTVTNSTGGDIAVNDVVVESGSAPATPLDKTKFTETAEVAATCTAKGTKAYYTYEGNTTDKYIKTDDGDYKKITAATELDIAIDDNAHDITGQESTATYAWNADKTECTATVECSLDSAHKVEVKSVNVTSKITTEPSATAPGVRTYTAEFENTALNTTTTESVDNADLADQAAADAAKEAVEAELAKITATNETSKADIAAVVTAALTTLDNGVTCDTDAGLTVTVTEATKEAAGSVVISATLTKGNGTATATATLPIAQLSSTATAAETAKPVVNAYLEALTVTKDTTSAKVTEDVQKLMPAGTTVTVTVTPSADGKTADISADITASDSSTETVAVKTKEVATAGGSDVKGDLNADEVVDAKDLAVLKRILRELGRF